MEDVLPREEDENLPARREQAHTMGQIRMDPLSRHSCYVIHAILQNPEGACPFANFPFTLSDPPNMAPAFQSNTAISAKGFVALDEVSWPLPHANLCQCLQSVPPFRTANRFFFNSFSFSFCSHCR